MGVFSRGIESTVSQCYSWKVDVNKKYCQCYRWQELRMPCCHGMWALKKLNKVLEDYIDNLFFLLPSRCDNCHPNKTTNNSQGATSQKENDTWTRKKE